MKEAADRAREGHLHLHPFTLGFLALVFFTGLIFWRVDSAFDTLQAETEASLAQADVAANQTEILSELTVLLDQQEHTLGAVNCVLGLLFTPPSERVGLLEDSSRDLPGGCETLEAEELEALLSYMNP